MYLTNSINKTNNLFPYYGYFIQFNQSCPGIIKNEKMKNTHGGVLIIVKLQTETCNFTKINTSPWVFFTFFKLYKWDQIAQRITYIDSFY